LIIYFEFSTLDKKSKIVNTESIESNADKKGDFKNDKLF